MASRLGRHRRAQHPDGGAGQERRRGWGRSRPRPGPAASTCRPPPRPGRGRRGCSCGRWPAPGGAGGARRRPRRGAGRVAARSPLGAAHVEGVVDHGGVEAPRRPSPPAVRWLITTWRQAGSSIGQFGDVLPPGVLPRRVVVVDDGGPAPQGAGDGARRRQVQRDRQDVLGDHDVGAVDGGDADRPRRAPRCCRRRGRGTRWSTSPTPAMVVTSKPSSASARRHVSATTDTPSGRPRRNETRAAVGTVDQVTVGAATVAGPWSSSRCSTT